MLDFGTMTISNFSDLVRAAEQNHPTYSVPVKVTMLACLKYVPKEADSSDIKAVQHYKTLQVFCRTHVSAALESKHIKGKEIDRWANRQTKQQQKRDQSAYIDNTPERLNLGLDIMTTHTKNTCR